MSRKPFLSDTSKIFIKKITDSFIDGEELSKTSITVSPIYTSSERRLIKGSKYIIIHETIRESIESTPWIGQTLTFNVNGKSIRIFLHHPISTITLKKIEKWFSQIKYSIFAWLFVASLESSTGCSSELDIYLYFTDFKKQLPAIDRTPISEINVNTGFTYSCKMSESGKNEIYIYRKEEWFKVLIHESFHAFSLDFLNMSNDLISEADQNVRKIFPLNIDLRYYETYCETWAEVIQIIWLSRRELMNNKFTMFERLIKKDQIHSIKQAVKVLRHFHMTYNDLFEKTDAAQIKRRGYREITPVMCYYIIKSIFYTHIDIYIEWTTVKNRGSLNFRKTKENLDSYVGLLRELHNSGKCLKLMNSIIIPRGGAEDNHLRMSIHGY